MRITRHGVVTVGLASACLLAMPMPATAGSSHSKTPTAPATITIRGRGFGHGVGMAQDGDLALGRAGETMPRILGSFYPGTSFASEPDVPVRVAVLAATASAGITVRLPAGGAARAGDSGVLVRPGGAVSLTHTSAGYRVTLLDPPTSLRKDQRSARGPTAYAVSSPGPETLTATGRTYRGVISVISDGAKLRAIDTLPIETYLDGLGEVRDPGWPAASLQALAVAARTYALHSLHPGASFDVWDDDRSQVYLGAGGEYTQLTEAVNATRGLVLTYAGALADTVYSASGGGETATAAEGFGDSAAATTNEPYLVAAAYPTADPQRWSITLPLATVAARLGYPGTMSAMTISAVGPSGRATAVTLTGSAGTTVVSGQAVYADLDLRSTLYTLVAPKPKPAAARTGTPAPATTGPGPLTSPAPAADPAAPARRAAGTAPAGTPPAITPPGTTPEATPVALAADRHRSETVPALGLISWLLAATCCGAATIGRRRRSRLR